MTQAIVRKLVWYQQDIKAAIKQEFVNGHRWVLVQAPTRSGKTVIFADIINDVLEKAYNDEKVKDVLVLVQDEKLIGQIRETLHDWHGISAIPIISSTKSINKRELFGTCRVFVAMVETINNRLKLESFRDEFKDVNLIIADEAHFSNYKKIYKLPMFEKVRRIGFTATPVSMDKKDPLYPTYFTVLVEGPTIRQLQEYNRKEPQYGVVPDLYFRIQSGVDLSDIPEDEDGEINQDMIADRKSGRYELKNTVKEYIKKAYGKRMLCFCANKQHSKDQCLAFIEEGIPARHIDSDMDKDFVKAALKWFKATPGAILCNVRMTATGFDAKWCEGVILNTKTKSIAFFKQAGARAQTPYLYPNGGYKEYGYILDMCDNYSLHGEWSDDVDWKQYFYRPKYYVPGVASKKICEACSAVNATSARICKVCDNPFDIASHTYNEIEKSLVLISKDVDVSKTIEVFSSRSEYASFYDILRQLAYLARKRLNIHNEDNFQYLLEQEDFEEIWREAQRLIKEWRELKGKKEINIPYSSVRYSMQEQLEKHGFTVMVKPHDEGILAGKGTKL